MSNYPKVQTYYSNSHLKLQTLIRLRWLSVLGQLSTILIVYYIVGYDLPMLECLGMILVLVGINVYLKIKYRSTARLPDNCTALQLAGDILQLSGMFFLTGGLGNPFSLLLLAPVIISATTMTPKWTIFLVVIASFSATILTFYHIPLPWVKTEIFQLPFLYVLSVWIALVFSLGFMAFYGFRVAKEARQLSDALSATELVVAREQQLHALDGLAAAAAHELGTPLATIHLAAKELESELDADDSHREDIVLIRNQSDRCREILKKLTKLTADTDNIYTQIPVSQLLEEVINPHRENGVKINTHVSGDGTEPISKRNPAIHYGLGNLIENAVDFAQSTVDIVAEWNAMDLTIKIADDGPGFSSDILSKLGEPYLTSRSRSNNNDKDEKAGGLGLGVFIAKTLLERSGGFVTLNNKKGQDTGALIEIIWPRAAMDLATENAVEQMSV